MKTLEEWSIAFYGLEKDKEQNNARWQVMKESVDKMVLFLIAVITDQEPAVICESSSFPLMAALIITGSYH